LLICLLAIFLSCRSAAADACEKWMAKVVSAQGSVQALRANEKQWLPVKLYDTYCPGDRIRVLSKSRADIVLFNETSLRLDQNTTVTFSTPEEEKTSLIGLLRGAVHFFSRQRRSIRVVTPFVNGTVEGTEFYMEVKADKTFLSIYEGQVIAKNQAGEIRLTKGQSATVMEDQPPVLQIVARPRDAIQWTLYYPPVLDYHPSDFQPPFPADWQASVQKSVESYREGNLEKAIGILSEIKEGVQDPRFFTYRASLLLSVGRVDEAKSDIEKSLQSMPTNSDALALQSVIAVAQNDRVMALDLARKAREANPQSSSARVALSYALQANVDLQGALNSLKESVKLEPKKGLAWARLAELWLSFGNLKEALKAAERATTLNPNLSRTQTVLGFAYLDQIKIKKSREAFERAIRFDQGDPLPRLGLGLAKIREGKLSDGREEIEIAASLDPDNALIRSYLGKAFYEEKRDKLAANQFAAAKDLDPLDPTPHFYDAILKQTMNRPVEALRDMQTSISLNDNRAVYRSRLLLDQDLAARSASLGRIYNDIGFQPLAVVEGWKSINVDPSNFSAHRLLSDTYAALPRHEIARVSELLQSQLLQPINITPLQPHLSQNNLLLLGGEGPSTPSFNEFNPLFTRDRVTLQVSGLGGENSSLADEAILAGIWGPVSYSVGQFYYRTDGFRKNNELTQTVYNAFVQTSLTPQTSVLGEFQSNSTDFRDLMLRYFPNDFLNERTQEKTYGARFGFHHAFAPGSDLIGCFTYQNGDFKYHDKELVWLGGILGLKDREDSYSGELQYLFRSQMANFVGGAGYFSVSGNSDTGFYIPGILPPFPLSSIDLDIHHTNLYLYGYLNFIKNLTVTVGASGDFFQGGITDQNQFNPKFGVTWNPFASTTLRGAAFRTFNRTLINSQTIEPTQVAGFNQFFDDFEATDAWNFGIAIDQRFPNNFFGGAEALARNLEVPFVDTSLSTGKSKLSKADWKERMIRAYFLWTPHPWFALSAEYLYEKLNQEDNPLLGIVDARTQRLPMAVSFFHPSGLSAFVKAAYLNQKGDFRTARYLPGTSFEGEDQFWIVDAAISYRLPKRVGFLTVGAKNLFDRSFRYQDTDYRNPLFQPARTIYAKVTLSF
jgi:tetratricopeptide (TPR) repeat protein